MPSRLCRMSLVVVLVERNVSWLESDAQCSSARLPLPLPCCAQAKIAMLVMDTNRDLSSDEEVEEENADGEDDGEDDGPAMLPFEEEITDIVRRGVEEGVNPVCLGLRVEG